VAEEHDIAGQHVSVSMSVEECKYSL